MTNIRPGDMTIYRDSLAIFLGSKRELRVYRNLVAVQQRPAAIISSDSTNVRVNSVLVGNLLDQVSYRSKAQSFRTDSEATGFLKQLFKDANFNKKIFGSFSDTFARFLSQLRELPKHRGTRMYSYVKDQPPSEVCDPDKTDDLDKQADTKLNKGRKQKLSENEIQSSRKKVRFADEDVVRYYTPEGI